MTGPPDRATLVAQASNWLIRHQSGQMDARDAEAFEAWLRASSAHQAAMDSVQRSWGLMAKVEDDDAVVDVRDHDARVMRQGRRMQALAAAVACVAVLGAGSWGLAQVGVIPSLGWFAPAPVQEFGTTVGQRATTKLADGSVVTLDTDTLIRVRLTDRERHIELERGQAFFQVAKDKSRPFVVAAAGKTVRATGTAFDVRTEAGRFEVTLVEGRVQVREAGKQREGAPVADLRQGWRLSVGEDARWRMEAVDIVRETAWHGGMLIFREESVAQAVQEMNRYSRRKIVFRGPPPDIPMLGQFQAGDVDSFARGLELNKVARIVSQTEEQIEIAAR